jgi:hypothetical protein
VATHLGKARSARLTFIALAVPAWLVMSCGRTPIQWSAQPQPNTGVDAGPGHFDVAPDLHPDTPPDHAPSDTTPPDAPREVRADVVDMRPPDMKVEVGPPDMRVEVDTGTCPVDCNHLPHVRSGVVVECRAGQCIVPFGACETGFAHCSINPNDGCEADLSTPSNCNGCGIRCSAPYSQCKDGNGYHFCGIPCTAPQPDDCGFYCVDLQSDMSNCGTCGNYCYLPGANTVCQGGRCTMTGCADSTFADCTADPGCETQLGSDGNCGGCGDRSCVLANTLFTCNDGTGCGAAICAPGFGNCDVTSADCEASFTATTRPACLPRYGGTVPIATQDFDGAVTAMAPDGSFFLAGMFTGSVDFDPSAGRDVRTATSNIDGFITRFNADGSYAWTATLGGRGDVVLSGLAVTSTGGVVATGSYGDAIDLDPSATTADLHVTANAYATEPFVLKLTAAGVFVWGKTFSGADDGTSGGGNAVAVDATDSVYVAGSYQGNIDFDPGAGTDVQSGPLTSGFLTKLTSAGAYGWTRTLADGDCTAMLNAVAVATDGNVWATGDVDSGPGCTLSGRSSDNQQEDVLIVKIGAGGNAVGTWTIGDTFSDAGFAMTAGRDGSMYIGGTAAGRVDFDPGTGVTQRWAGLYGDGFVLKLDATGVFRWVRVLDQMQVVSLAGAPDGGVVAGTATVVSRITADGASVWTFNAGDGGSFVRSVASAGGGFVVAGTSSGSQDFDPGPDLDLIYGDVLFVSRYTF